MPMRIIILVSYIVLVTLIIMALQILRKTFIMLMEQNIQEEPPKVVKVNGEIVVVNTDT